LSKEKAIEEVKLDFCVGCRQVIDRALDVLPMDKIYILADLSVEGPTRDYNVIRLCEQCGNFIYNKLEVQGFTVYEP